MHDVQFFEYLIKERNLPEFQAVSCGFVAGAPPGRDGIGYLTRALDALPGVPYFATLEAILIVADNDSDPTEAFENVQRLIGATAEITPDIRYVAPTAPLEKGGSSPTIVIMMLPWVEIPGALDTVCLSCAVAKRPTIASAVDKFAASTGADTWPITKQSKMKLRSLMSAAHQDDPYLSPAWVWRDGTDLVPLSDSSFNKIAAFLQNFDGFLLA